MVEVNEIVGGFLLLSNKVRIGISPVIQVKGKNNIVYDTGGPNARQHLSEELQKKSIDPEKVDTLVISHSHWDHAMNPDIFPNARILLGKDEYEYGGKVSGTDWATPSYINRLYEGREVELIDSDMELETGVDLIQVPGHTPGTLALSVDIKDGRAILGSDALFNARSFLAGEPFLIFHSKDKARQSMKKMKEAGDLFYPGHDRPFKLSDGKIEYISDTRIDISAIMGPHKGDDIHYSIDTMRN